MYDIQTVHQQKSEKAKHAAEKEGGVGPEQLEHQCKERKWGELVCILHELEKEYGWEVVGVHAVDSYTKDEDPSHKSMVLGEQASSRGPSLS